MQKRRPELFLICVAISCAALCCAFSNCVKAKHVLHVTPGSGLDLPAVSALAWLAADDPSKGERFASLSADGVTRVWEINSGRLLSAAKTEEPLSLLAEGGAFISYTGKEDATHLLSPDGTKKIFPAPDGAVCLAGSAKESIIARYYGFAEWLSIVPEGFYNASFRGPSFFIAEYRGKSYSLEQLSGALFRPDAFTATVLSGPRSAPKNLDSSLFEPEKLFGHDPPAVSISAEDGGIKITVSAGKGGAGFLALYRKSQGDDIPAGLLDIEKAAEKKYREKGKTCYEITLPFEPGEPGSSSGITAAVSAFNKYNTIESRRIWMDVALPAHGQSGETSIAGTASAAVSAPALKVLLAANDAPFLEQATALGGLFTRQADGDLYFTVEVETLFGADFTHAGFIKTAEELFGNVKKNDVLVLYIQGRGRADSSGNLRIMADSKNEISGEDILKSLLINSSNPLLFMDLLSDSTGPESGASSLETALFRFRQRFGPRAMLVRSSPYKTPDANNSVVSALRDKLETGFLASGLMRDRYMQAGQLLELAGLSSGGGRYTLFSPLEDFRIADLLIKSGELKFQTMASGMLRIDQVDGNYAPLNFGETKSRILPAGRYIIDMVYRNGYRETRTVELREKNSAWVIFTYTPPLMAGDFSLLRSISGANGIQISELNPVNYQKINQEVMEGMGMAPNYVAFLSGEKLYREGNYDRAIAEYSRSISLKSDYAGAYVSRGNAQRRKGDYTRAIEDYTRALSLKRDYPEVYNYRGFVYTQQGDLNRAIADYTQAIRYKADYADAYFNRAHAYGKQGSWDLCIADYTQVIKLEPANAIAYNERGNAWSGKGDKARAGADYEAALKFMKR